MAKRFFDLLVSITGLVAASPVLLPVILLIYLQDRHSPFYVAPRVGKDNIDFRMIKLRSMCVEADKTGVTSTSANDRRITPVGAFVRRYKLDELMQFWNVLLGDMSVVGPRPNVRRNGVDLYTSLEMGLLSVKPGVTDFASIVFADEGEILKDHADADAAYNRLIRPGKSMLGLFYIERQSIWIDIQVCWLTALAILSRRRALHGVQALLHELGARDELIEIAGRRSALLPKPPPGSTT